jgi:hypothetical protein
MNGTTSLLTPLAVSAGAGNEGKPQSSLMGLIAGEDRLWGIHDITALNYQDDALS